MKDEEDMELKKQVMHISAKAAMNLGTIFLINQLYLKNLKVNGKS